MLSWFAIVTIIIGAFNTRSIMLSGKLPPVVSWRFRPYAEITKYSIKYSTYAAVRNASSPLGISSASRRFMEKPVPIRLSPKASRMLPFGGEDTKRNFKHANRLQLNRVSGPEAAGTDLEPTPATFPSGNPPSKGCVPSRAATDARDHRVPDCDLARAGNRRRAAGTLYSIA